MSNKGGQGALLRAMPTLSLERRRERWARRLRSRASSDKVEFWRLCLTDSNRRLFLLQRQTHTKRTIDRADDLALPAQHARIAPQDRPDAPCADREHDRAQQSQRDEDQPED